MANPFIEYVKEWRKKNPNVIYKDALKKAAVDYKKEKSGTSQSVKSDTSPKKKAITPKSKDDKNSRSRSLTMYKKLLSNVEKSISNNQIIDETEYDKYRKLANELRGKSQTNQYAKKLKEIDRKLKSKKYLKLASKLSGESKQLEMKIADKKKSKSDKDKVLNEVFETGVRKSNRQDNRRRQLAKLTDGKGNKKYDKNQIEEIIKLEDLGLTARELKETTSALGKYLPEDFQKEFLRINPAFTKPNARAYIAINQLYKTNPFEVPIITDAEVIKIANKTNAFTTAPDAPSLPPPPPPTPSLPPTKSGVKLSKKQKENYDEVFKLFGLNDDTRDISGETVYNDLYTIDKFTNKTQVSALERKVEALKKKYTSGDTLDRLEDITGVLQEYTVRLPQIRKLSKPPRTPSGSSIPPTPATPPPQPKVKVVKPKAGGGKKKLPTPPTTPSSPTTPTPTLGKVEDMLRKLALTQSEKEEEELLEDVANFLGGIDDTTTELEEKLVKVSESGNAKEIEKATKELLEQREEARESGKKVKDALSERFGDAGDKRDIIIQKEQAESDEIKRKIKEIDDAISSIESNKTGLLEELEKVRLERKTQFDPHSEDFGRAIKFIIDGKEPLVFKDAVETAKQKHQTLFDEIEQLKNDGKSPKEIRKIIDKRETLNEFVKDARYNVSQDLGFDEVEKKHRSFQDRIDEADGEIEKLRTTYPTSGDLSGAGFVNLVQRGMGRGNDVKRVSNVSSEDKVYAEISHAVYDAPNVRPKFILGYRLMDTSEYNRERQVVYSKSKDDIIIGYRGTDDGRDVMTDVKLAMGNLKSSFRFKKDLDWTHSVMDSLSPSKVVFTGHSLGGTIAIEMCDIFRKNTRAVVFNAGQGIKMGKRNHLNIRFYSVKGDLVSMLGTGAYKDVRILANDDTAKNKTPLGAHSTENFDVGRTENFVDTEEKPEEESEEESGGSLYSKMKSGFKSVGDHINMKNFKKATEILGDMEKLNDMMPEKYQNSMLNEIKSIKKILV
tara:strand:- start:1357 stop:4380 length:3024 start_codon:yes stop_codon:yes gene_type:complete